MIKPLKKNLLTRRVLAAAFMCMMSISFVAGAASLGRLTLYSSLGQPLDAEVVLVSVPLSTGLHGQIGSEAAYAAAGLSFDFVLDTARVTLQRRPGGQPYLRITTTRPIKTTHLPLLLQVNTGSGELSATYDLTVSSTLAAEVIVEPRLFRQSGRELSVADRPVRRAPGMDQAAPVEQSSGPQPSSSAPARAGSGAPLTTPARPAPDASPSVPSSAGVVRIDQPRTTPPRAVIPLPPTSAAPVQRGERPPPGRTRILNVRQARVPPAIDGVIEDVAWKGAAFADRFWISEQERWPSERTEALVMADKDYLYVAFRVYESQPDRIQALQTRRGAGLGLDDQVAVELDPYLSYREISTYAVNAHGVQSEAIAGGRANQIAWRGDWQAATARTDYGWSAEMAIPFAILNFESGASQMAVNFVRYHNRTAEWSRWADVTVRSLPEEMGRLTGLVLPALTKTQPWTFMPYAVIGQNVPDKKGMIQENFKNAGIDIRYQPRPNVTGVVSLNPDFSQIESSVAGINFNYNEKFRVDPRPFFQEGSAYFGGREYFYTNRVPDFDYGGKFFARMAGYQIGALATRSPDDRTDTAFRLQKDFDPTHSIAGTIVTTERENLRNQLYAVRGQGRETSGLNYSLDVATTSTEIQAGDGSKMSANVGWSRDYWSAGLSGDRYSRNFRPANGLLEADLQDTYGTSVFASYYRDFGDAPVRELRGDASFTTRWTSDHRKQRHTTYTGGSVELRQQVRVGFYYTDGMYRPLRGGPGVWSSRLNHDNFWTAALDFNTRSSRLGYGGTYSKGSLGAGEYEFTSLYAWTRPTRTTFINTTAERLWSFGVFEQYIVSAGWDITSRMTVAGRWVSNEFGDAYRLAYSLNVAKNMDVFLVYDRDGLQPVKLSAKILMTLH